jgi:hypothetical protein
MLRDIRYFGSRNKSTRSLGISDTLKRSILNVKNKMLVDQDSGMISPETGFDHYGSES